MSESTSAFEPGLYVKGDQTRQAGTRADAVNLTWEGFVRVTAESAADLDYSDLQAQARTLGIPANQKKADLAEAVANFNGEDAATLGNPGAVPETGSESPLSNS